MTTQTRFCGYCGKTKPMFEGYDDCPQAQDGKAQLEAILDNIKENFGPDAKPKSVNFIPNSSHPLDVIHGRKKFERDQASMITQIKVTGGQLAPEYRQNDLQSN